MEWQAVVGLETGVCILEIPNREPNPTIEVEEVMPDGTEFKAVWAYLKTSDVAKLVTVHFFDE